MDLHHTEEVAHYDAMSAIFLKGHLKLMSVDMKNSQISKTDMLAKATKITGKAYKRGSYSEAVADLQVLIDHFKVVNVAEKAERNRLPNLL